MQNAGLLLPHDEILKLRAAVISAGLAKSRNPLLAGIDAAFLAGLSDEGAPGAQILSDLDALNAAGELGDGSVPLTVWLRNALALAGPRREAKVFRHALEQLGGAGNADVAQGAAPTQQAGGSTGVVQYSVNLSNSTVGSLAVGDGASSDAHLTQGSASSTQPQGGPAGQAPAAATHGSGSTQAADIPIDFAILTAIEVERRAVCAAFGLGKDHRIKRSGRWYWRGQLPLAGGSAYEIVVGQPAEMGQVEATALTKDVLRDWKPSAALLVGIAASTDPSKVKLGDVVVGKSIWYYEHGKVTEQGTKPQPEMIPADAGLLQHLTGMDDWDGNVAVERPDGTDATPKVHAGVIASGEKVIADAAVRDEIASGHRKMMAIAMEDYGFARAIGQSMERVQHLVVRGICDEASKDKTDGWHGYAAASAAGFAKSA